MQSYEKMSDPPAYSSLPAQQQQQRMAPFVHLPQPVITQQPAPSHVIVQQVSFGINPHRLVCPQCRQNIVSAVESEVNCKTHIGAILIAMLGGVLGCCLIPYCVDSCQSQRHTCPRCGTYLGMRD